MEPKAKLVAYLRDHFVVTPRLANRMGVNRMHLQRYVAEGDVKKIARGVYAQDDAFLLDPVLCYLPFLIRWPLAVVSGISALQYYGLTDANFRVRWVTLPKSRRVASPNNFKIIYGQGGFYSLGIRTIKIKKATIKVYDPEKSLIQVFKYGDFETGLAALKNYLKSDRVNLKKLSQYGKILRHSLDDRVLSLLAQ